MAGRPFGVSSARDEVTLAQVEMLNLNMVLECLGKFPPETTMKQIAKAAKCKNRGCRGNSGAEVLFRTGDYSDDWWPRTPLVRR